MKTRGLDVLCLWPHNAAAAELQTVHSTPPKGTSDFRTSSWIIPILPVEMGADISELNFRWHGGEWQLRRRFCVCWPLVWETEVDSVLQEGAMQQVLAEKDN